VPSTCRPQLWFGQVRNQHHEPMVNVFCQSLALYLGIFALGSR